MRRNKQLETKSLTRKQLLFGIFLFSITLLSIAVSVIWSTEMKSDKPEEKTKVEDKVVTISTDSPDETPPDPYEVAAEDPRRIILPSINKEGFVQKVGIDQDGKIAVPTNVHIAGWYVDSARPGEEGLSIIDGHRDGISTTGIFRYISQLVEGDEVIIEFGDRTTRKFEVIDTIQTTTEEMQGILYQQLSEQNIQLNLISCGGTFDQSIGTYDERVLVRTIVKE